MRETGMTDDSDVLGTARPNIMGGRPWPTSGPTYFCHFFLSRSDSRFYVVTKTPGTTYVASDVHA